VVKIKSDTLYEVRCLECNKLLGKLEGKLIVKCTRCGTMNSFDNIKINKEQFK